MACYVTACVWYCHVWFAGVSSVYVGKDSHSGGLENLLSASSLAETHISPDDMPFTDQDDNRTLR